MRGGGSLGQDHSARLASSADQDLRLDDDRLADLIRDLPRLARREGYLACGDRDSGFDKERPRLIFVEFQASCMSLISASATSDVPTAVGSSRLGFMS